MLWYLAPHAVNLGLQLLLFFFCHVTEFVMLLPVQQRLLLWRGQTELLLSSLSRQAAIHADKPVVLLLELLSVRYLGYTKVVDSVDTRKESSSVNLMHEVLNVLQRIVIEDIGKRAVAVSYEIVEDSGPAVGFGACCSTTFSMRANALFIRSTFAESKK